MEEQIEVYLRRDDFQEICRVCLTHSENFTSLSTQSNCKNCPLNYAQLITAFTFIQIGIGESQDLLPWQICESCALQLQNFVKFREKCENSDKILHEILESPEFKFDTNSEIVAEYLEESNCKDNNDSLIRIKEFDLIHDTKFTEEHNFTSNNVIEVVENDDKYINIKVMFVGHDKIEIKEEPDLCDEILDESIQNQEDLVTEEIVLEQQEILLEKEEIGEDKLDQKMEKFICETCGSQLKSLLYLKEHMKYMHGELSYCCQYCGKMFKSSSNLKRHLMIHTNYRPHKCDQCSSSFTQFSKLQEHVRSRHTGIRPFACQYCPKKFITKTHMKRHETTHSIENIERKTNMTRRQHLLPNGQTVKCDKCNKTFNSLIGLNVHMQTHNLVNIKCNFCENSFSNEFHLKKHQCLLNEERRFMCVKCGYKFPTQAHLTIHSYKHTGEKPFVCKESKCGKSFHTKANLKRHTLSHTGERPYRCNICDKSFFQWSHLNYHKIIHSGERPFVCHICSHDFALKMNYDCHMRRHAGDRKYKCEFCEERFYDVTSRCKHKKKMHDVQKFNDS